MDMLRNHLTEELLVSSRFQPATLPQQGTAFLARQHATNVFTVTWSPDNMHITLASWEKLMLIRSTETPHNGPGDSNGDSGTMTPYKSGRQPRGGSYSLVADAKMSPVP